MDRRTLLAIVLIALVTLTIPTYFQWLGLTPPPAEQTEMDPDSLDITPPENMSATAPLVIEPEAAIEKIDPLPLPEQKRSDLAKSAEDTRTINIDTELLSITLSSARGGNFVEWDLKDYDFYQGGKVNLAGKDNGINIQMTNSDGKRIQTINYNMFSDFSEDQNITLNKEKTTTSVEFYLPVGQGRLVQEYTFYHDRYSFDLTVRLESLQNTVINRRYYVNWQGGVNPTEENKFEDYDYNRAYVYQAGELEDFNADDADEVFERTFSGRVDWTAMRTKYFLMSIIPATPADIEGIQLKGTAETVDEILRKSYDASLEVDFNSTGLQTEKFTIYLGPLKHDIVSDYGVGLEELVMNKDWYEGLWLFRMINLYFILPLFNWLHTFIPNYGWVIIVFSILIKFITYPLTKKSYQSMAKMQELSPKMQALKEQYKDNPQKMQQETMRLYKEHGANPLGGCLPMLLQMPLLFALFIAFRSTIELRGAPWVGWITDLSLPDALPLGFSLPFIGDTLAVLPIFMAVSMIFQSQATVTDPRQKMMIYMMPAFMLFIFYGLPSGLNLYYSIFNVLTFLQNKWIKKDMPQAEDTKATQGKAVPRSPVKPSNGQQKKSSSSRPARKKKKR